MDCVIHRTIIIRFGLIIRFRFRDLIFSPHDTDDIVQPEDDLEDTSANRPQSETTIRRNQPILRPLLPPEPPVTDTIVVQMEEEDERPRKMPRLVQNEIVVRRSRRSRMPKKRYQ